MVSAARLAELFRSEASKAARRAAFLYSGGVLSGARRVVELAGVTSPSHSLRAPAIPVVSPTYPRGSFFCEGIGISSYIPLEKLNANRCSSRSTRSVAQSGGSGKHRPRRCAGPDLAGKRRADPVACPHVTLPGRRGTGPAAGHVPCPCGAGHQPDGNR